ncbi:hypothetical protein SLS62_001597 [Diatrype stigma]|uniref:ORC6 first cyclin-like domain-containing protein n=1 Tax=Diatrype stigma TaxID=117547 RepID=A0AAN9UYR3_9PEZI
MSRALENDLFSLLPTYSQALPQPLVELASSLLTQSRHRASTLKQEEEIARAYACCHIACERLKISLDLPAIHPRPPVPPRVYHRLYTHLDKILPANAGRGARTPSSKLRGTAALGSGQRTPSRATPTKEASLAQFRSPARRGDGTPTKSTGKPPAIAVKRKAGGAASALPGWIRPTVQFLCKELDEERIGKTVLAGMQTIAAPHGQPTKDEWVNEHLTPLLAAVYFLVAAELHSFEHSGEEGDSSMVAARMLKRLLKPMLKTLERAPAEITVRDMDEDELWIGWTDTGPKDFEAAMHKVKESGWQNGHWFTTIKNLARTSDSDEAEAEAEDDDVQMEDADGRVSEKLHLQKGDSMFQSRWVMTDKKRGEYRAWKEEMMQRIEEAAEKRQGGSAAVDTAE